ncbi:P-loop NTPase [bacterium]|nr:P-loop NTPase [bacterium]
MKIIAVSGGKGGVGKSTVAVLSALSLAKKEKVVLVDADVECPNDYLLLGKKLSSPVKTIFALFPRLIKSKCRRCGLCAQKCRFHAIFAPPGQYPVFLHDLCSNCGLCWHLCPFGAIKTVKKKRGVVYQNKINRNLLLITGKSLGIVEETGPIVKELKKYALAKAKKWGAKRVIIDTAAGTHCSVIQALLGADKLVAVTEPTPLGEHDLGLILSLGKKLGLPAVVVINQADLGKKKGILQVAREYQVKVEKKIPYSRQLAQAYARGKLAELDFKLDFNFCQ